MLVLHYQFTIIIHFLLFSWTHTLNKFCNILHTACRLVNIPDFFQCADLLISTASIWLTLILAGFFSSIYCAGNQLKTLSYFYYFSATWLDSKYWGCRNNYFTAGSLHGSHDLRYGGGVYVFVRIWTQKPVSKRWTKTSLFLIYS